MITPVGLARLFHDTYETLAPSFGYETRTDSRKPWDDVPEPNRMLMIAVCTEILKQFDYPLRRAAQFGDVPIPRELYGAYHRFPVVVQAVMDIAPAVEVPDPPPALGRNSEMAFALTPVDETRLGEVLLFLRNIGFFTQTVNIRRWLDDFAMVDITFGQGQDPRLQS
jgi:hypothetical protein